MSVQEFSKGEVIEQVNRTMNEGFEIPLEKLKPEARLFSDLGLDSLDAVDMVVHLEEKFGIKLDAEELKSIRTMGDVYNLVGGLASHSKDKA